MQEEQRGAETTAEIVRRQFDEREEKIREAAKWLIASFAAVGAALIAGSQLSSIGRLPLCVDWSMDCARLWVALLGTVASLVGVVLAIWIGVTLLVPDPAPVHALKGEWQGKDPYLRTYFTENRSLLQGFDDFEDVDRQEKAAYLEVDRLRELVEEASGPGQAELEEEYRAADAHPADILERSDVLVSTANHVRFVHAFQASLVGSSRTRGLPFSPWDSRVRVGGESARCVSCRIDARSKSDRRKSDWGESP